MQDVGYMPRRFCTHPLDLVKFDQRVWVYAEQRSMQLGPGAKAQRADRIYNPDRRTINLEATNAITLLQLTSRILRISLRGPSEMFVTP